MKEEIYRFGRCVVLVHRRQVLLDGLDQHIEPLPFDLLVLLIRMRGHVVSKDQLIDHVWGGRCVTDGVIATALQKARVAIGDGGRRSATIVTHHRRGYCFAAELLAVPQADGAAWAWHPGSARNPAPGRIVDELRSADSALFNLMDAMPDPIFLKDQDHRWVFVNQEFCKIVGHVRHELLGKSDYDFFPEAQAEGFWKMDDLVFRSQVENVNAEIITSPSGITRRATSKKRIFTDASREVFLLGTLSLDS